jgi:3-hydroxybutyrate dehydrogenase
VAAGRAQRSPVEGRSALVTGAASGIGLAIARALTAGGARVTLVDLPGDALVGAARDLGARHLAADLALRDDVTRIVSEAGGVEILVSNAGLQHVSPIDEFPEDTWDRLLAVMLTAPFLLAKGFLPAMYEAGWGRVINVASVHGLVASPYKAAYVAAKHGVVGLVKVLALEGADHGISATAICPGYVRTPIVESQVEAQSRATGVPPERVVEDVLLAPQAVKRLLEPEDVADTAAFLLGPAGRAFTGAPVVMDLGWTAR